MHRPQTRPLSQPEPLLSARVENPGRKLPVEAIHFGSLLLARRVINAEQLDHALALQAESPYLRLGEILLGLGYISFSQLRSTLEDQYHDVKLGQYLLRLGIISLEHIEKALEAQEKTGDRLGPVLIAIGACSEAQMYRVLASQDLG